MADGPPPEWVIASATAFDAIILVVGLCLYKNLVGLVVATNTTGHHPYVQMWMYSQLWLYAFSCVVCVSLMWASNKNNSWASAGWVFVVIPPFHIVFFFVPLLITKNDWNEEIDVQRAQAPKELDVERDHYPPQQYQVSSRSISVAMGDATPPAEMYRDTSRSGSRATIMTPPVPYEMRGSHQAAFAAADDLPDRHIVI